MTNLTQETKAAFPPLVPAAANREYKSTVFSLLYRNRKRLLSLYNAMNHSHYTNSDELIIVTLENAIYMAISLSEAVEQAVTECIREGILADFLEANRREVVAMSIFEYDAE